VAPLLALLAGFLLIEPMAALSESIAQEPRLATKNEYLSCLQEMSSIEGKRGDLSAKEAKHKERAAKFQAAEADLAAQVKKHTPSTKKEIESYNRAVAARNASAESLNKDSMSLQQQQTALNKQILETNAECSAITVSPEDAQAAEEEHRKRSVAK
jgi:hypothetical protein